MAPLLSDGVPVGDAKINHAMLGTLTRDDGTTLVTFNGWPLYYYYEDAAPRRHPRRRHWQLR